MEGIVYYIATAGVSVAAFGAGYALARKGKRYALAAAGVALGLVVAKALLHWKPVWEAALFPWPAYIYFQGYWLYPAALVFFGLAVPQLPVRWNRALVAGVAACVFAYSLRAGSWMIFPPDDRSTRRAGPDHHCRQSTMYTCAPAACVSLLSHWGIDATEGEMARLCLTRRHGTTVFNIYRGLVLKFEDKPFDIRVMNLTPGEFRELAVPAVVVDAGHCVVLRPDDGGAVILNPLADSPRRAGAETVRRYLAMPAVVVLPRGRE